MLKCGHFFCKVCILNKFYDKENKTISCPEDGIVAKELSDLKLLKNFIVDNDKSLSIENIDNLEGKYDANNVNISITLVL